ncbi:MAG: hypothetical protein WDO69_11115 [Pseudomonadota bacterium]
MHGPGVQFIEMALVVAVPVHVRGPLRVIFPSALTLPLNASKGAETASAHAFSVTCKLMPMNDESQWSAMFHSPLTSGQLLLPELPAVLSAPDGSEELELHAAHAAHNKATPNGIRIMSR